MADNLRHNYNGRYRLHTNDSKEDTMEAKLIPHPDWRDHVDVASGMKSFGDMCEPKLSLHQCARDGSEQNLKNLLRSLGPLARKLINHPDCSKLTPLHYAVRYNHLNIVKLLVESGADVQAQDENNVTPLHLTAHYQSKKKQIKDDTSDESVRSTSQHPDHSEPGSGSDIVSYLANKGANLNAVDSFNRTPLHYAAMRGNEVVCRELLHFENRIKIDACDSESTTPLHTAVLYNQAKIARMLIEAGADLMCEDDKMCRPLHYAAMNGNLELVQMLLETGTKSKQGLLLMYQMVNATDMMSNMPLHLAVENGHYDVAKLLLEKRTDVNKPRDYFIYPLHLAAEFGHADIARLLLENFAQVDAVNTDHATALHRAAACSRSQVASNYLEVAKVLIERGANVNSTDKDHCTPLLLATKNGNVEMVEFLLENGAYYTASDKYERTVVFLAAEKNHRHVLTKLLSYPSMKDLINQSDCDYNDPIHVAAQNGHLKVVQDLICNGADLNLKNQEEETPLHLAARFGRTNIVQELVKHSKCIINDEDEYSNTALHLAAKFGHTNVLKILIEWRANVRARNSKQRTPLHLAASQGWTKICQMLLKNGASVDEVDKNRVTPLLLATKYGHCQVVDLLLNSKADVTLRDNCGNNSLDRAIDNSHVDVAMLIVNSPVWKDALRNAKRDPTTGYTVTPMRKLIRKMPEVATRVFEKCLSPGQEKNRESPDYEITYDYEFIDDQYASWICQRLGQPDDEKRNSYVLSSGNSHGTHEEGLAASSKPYSSDSNVLKENHPLHIMILSKRSNLLTHPLVKTLLDHKWNSLASFFYYLSFSIYIIFLIFLTAFMISTDPPYLYGSDAALIENNQCGNLTKRYEQPLCASISTYVIIALAGFNLLKELFQIYQSRLNYIGWANVIEWIVYATALLLVINFNDCQKATGYRFAWQWSLGTVSVFLVWVGLVLFIQRFPRLCIYVVMLTEVIQTFGQFFIVLFLFIVAFAMAFFAAFQNKVVFGTVPRTMVKTYSMMAADFDFDDIFSDPIYKTLFYPEVSYILIVVFLTSMNIIIMNVLIGLAINDVKSLLEQAEFKRTAMHVELALNVEKIMPDFILRKAFCQTKTIFPNRKNKNPFWQLLSRLISLCFGLPGNNSPRLDEIEKLREAQNRLCEEVKRFEQSVSGIRNQNQKLESMLRAIIAAQDISWQEGDQSAEGEMDEMMLSSRHGLHYN